MWRRCALLLTVLAVSLAPAVGSITEAADAAPGPGGQWPVWVTPGTPLAVPSARDLVQKTPGVWTAMEFPSGARVRPVNPRVDHFILKAARNADMTAAFSRPVRTPLEGLLHQEHTVFHLPWVA